ncbi:histidine phosphatase family protein [Aphanothece hegewaldii CCALA 016]|uniref:Histidine phosphatase family protein n=1 Tax=Aphanothece hegewaldii CCALA 016 TaxID=2107694 RepID=A0A2T1LSV5_9CHRO|nr:histidine phosphatase family protein [Aphanothece hegewaldii]PSF33162.1 histidine phosphatase family protein [Aphanothece hegewaldii CCALA 016]
MSQTIWMARHGNRYDFVNPEWFNTAPRRYDPPLSDDGLIQAQDLALRLQGEKISHIFSSPFLRTIQTAYPVAELLDLPIKLEFGLSEWLNPQWMSNTPQLHFFEMLELNYSRIDWSYTSCVIPQYPESEKLMQQRTALTAKRLVSRFSDNILLVGHKASILGTTVELIGTEPNINTSFCALVKIVRKGDKWKMELNGDTSHFSQ